MSNLPADAARLLNSGHPACPIAMGYRMSNGTWQTQPFVQGAETGVTPAVSSRAETLSSGDISLVVVAPGADAVELVFELPPGIQVFGGGERFESLNLRGQSIRYYLENFGLGNGTYLPVPWLASTAGYALFLVGEQPAVFHVAAPHDPHVLRIQVEGERADVEIQNGDLAMLHRRQMARIGPPLMPSDSFFSLWKAGDWRHESSRTVAADRAGFDQLGLPLGVKLIDAYWEDEVHSFAFDPAKYPDAWDMVGALRDDGTETWLWLCPWVVVTSRSFDEARQAGYLIKDAQGELITQRPGANPNVVAALIDFSNADAAAWWSGNLRRLIQAGIAGFKADFGEQLPEHAVLASGETGGKAHNAYVRYYLEATTAAFDGEYPKMISRAGSPVVRTPLWSGDQTSDFCPKTGLPAVIRAVQSASLSGWSFVGSDLGGYFGTPTPQVFARWCQLACFTPLMMLHGLGCREPWDLDPPSTAIFKCYAELHLALRPQFRHYGRIAARGEMPIIRMMPLAYPTTDWQSVNDWDQQFMLGDDLLVAPSAFYGDTRAVHLPEGNWFDVLAGTWIAGPTWRVHEVPRDRIALFVRGGASLVLATGPDGRDATVLAFPPPDQKQLRVDPAQVAAELADPGWQATRLGLVGTGGATLTGPTHSPIEAPGWFARHDWFGSDMRWLNPTSGTAIDVQISE